jgi:hypothetical protein
MFCVRTKRSMNEILEQIKDFVNNYGNFIKTNL